MHLAGWRSGNAAVCKTDMHGFNSRPGLKQLIYPNNHGNLLPANKEQGRYVVKEATFEKVRKIILERAGAYLDKRDIKKRSHLASTLEIDSLDFIDIIFDIEIEFGIKIPLEEWTKQTNDGKVDADYYWQMSNFCDRIDELVVEKTRKDQEL